MRTLMITVTGLLWFALPAGAQQIKGFAPIPDRPGDFSVALEVVGGKTTFKLGETLDLRFKCSREGYLTLISIDPAGEAVLMFPNKWSAEAKVAADRWIGIPGEKAGFRLVARPPLGTTYVRAFVTPRPLVCVDALRAEDQTSGMSSLGKSGDRRLGRLLQEIKGFEPEPGEPVDDGPAMAIVTVRLMITDEKPRRADGKLLGEIPEGADLDRLTPDAAPKARLLAALRDSHVWYVKEHEKGLAIPPTFCFDPISGHHRLGTAKRTDQIRVDEVVVEFLVESGEGAASEIERLRSMRVHRVHVERPGDTAAAREKLRRQGARSVQRLMRYRLFGEPADGEPMLKLQWALQNTLSHAADSGALSAIREGVRRPVLVAVVDTGLCNGHPDLSAALYKNDSEVPGNGADDDGNGLVDDVSGFDFLEMKAAQLAGARDNHGTFVASVIASREDGRGVLGVCPWAEILPIRAGSDEAGLPTDAIVRGLLYAADAGAKIVNCSWGGYGDDPAIYRTMEVLRKKGVLIVCAAGNESNDNDVNPATPASFDLDNVISVAAMRVDGELADFSNWGASSVHLAAPGELIVGYPDGSGEVAAWDGTSFAAPMVAGAAALVWAKHPDWDYVRVKDAVLRTAKELPSLKGRVQTGGTLDITAAMRR